MFTYDTGELTVYEGATAFWLVNNETGEEVCMGDGVDLAPYNVGTPEFYASLCVTVQDPECKEAYFGS
jgi:hypothetical protein